MIKVLALAVPLFALTGLHASNAAPLDSYRDKARPVIVFGSENDAIFQQQMQALDRASDGLKERDIVVISVAKEGEHRDLRRFYRASPGKFELLLIGKDGGVKLRSREKITPDEIFRLVDGMPMRQKEMGRR